MHDGQGGPLWSGHTPFSTLAERQIATRDAIGLLCLTIVTSPPRMRPKISTPRKIKALEIEVHAATQSVNGAAGVIYVVQRGVDIVHHQVSL